MKKIKIPFWLETQINKIIQPNIVTIVETFIDGKPIKKFYGKSLVGNFLQTVYAYMNQDDAVNFVIGTAPFDDLTACLRIDTGAKNVGAITTGLLDITGSAGQTTFGTVLGSAVVVPAPGSFNVGTLITHGAGAGQLQYSAQGSTQGCVVSGSNTSFVLSRSFTNASGGNVTVNAIALYQTNIVGGVMIYLDSVSPADVIGNGQVYTVNLTFQIST